MIFTPHLKPKKGTINKLLLKPFPDVESNKKYEGTFSGICVEISAKEDIIDIYDNGFYGKGSQSRSAPQIVMNFSACTDALKGDNNIEESLSLSLEEAFFLAYYLNILKIRDLDGEEMDYKRFLDECLKVNKFFIESQATYLYLKSKGWIVKSGLKFGGNFLIYRKGPRFFHASFVVVTKISSDIEHLESKNLKGLQRIAETSDKDVLIIEVNKPANYDFHCPDAISNLELSEMVIRRFNCNFYVQNQNTTK